MATELYGENGRMVYDQLLGNYIGSIYNRPPVLESGAFQQGGHYLADSVHAIMPPAFAPADMRLLAEGLAGGVVDTSGEVSIYVGSLPGAEAPAIREGYEASFARATVNAPEADFSGVEGIAATKLPAEVPTELQPEVGSTGTGPGADIAPEGILEQVQDWISGHEPLAILGVLGIAGAGIYYLRRRRQPAEAI
ncbi:MAG: hypothetical protein JW727_03470 [Candidatus Aenigmarchaeota archaeon]|nr:hypothetical protein [Candidatus Aenigmarchaeota archaeon]